MPFRAILRTFVCLLMMIAWTLGSGSPTRASEEAQALEPEVASVEQAPTESGQMAGEDGACVCPSTTPAAGAADGDGDAEGEADEEDAGDEEDGPVCHGILTCTFWGLGKVLVLPFRLLRGALDIII